MGSPMRSISLGVCHAVPRKKKKSQIPSNPIQAYTGMKRTLAAPCGIANCAPAGQDSKTKADQRWKVIHLQGLSLHLRNHRPMISQSSLEPIRVQAYLVFLKTVTAKIFDSSPRSLAVFHLWGIPPERTRPLRLSS